MDRKASIGVGSAIERLGEGKDVDDVDGVGGAKTDCGEATVEPDPFSQRSANSLKLLDPTADEGDAPLTFLGGANGRSLGRSVAILSVSFLSFSLSSLNRDILFLVSLTGVDEVGVVAAVVGVEKAWAPTI